jgi:hypothetical protein
MENKRPPLGTPPWYITARMRLKDLNNAINRYLEEDHINTTCIKEWAKEIIAQCELMEKMDRKGDEE